MCNAESAFLLGKLIHGAPRLVLPYVAPIEKALVAKLRSAALLPAPLTAVLPGSKAAAKCALRLSSQWIIQPHVVSQAVHSTAASAAEGHPARRQGRRQV